MDIYQALKHVPAYKRLYFMWKHKIRFTDEANDKSEEEMLKEIGRKTNYGLKRWEKSAEYRALVVLLIESKIANDLEDIYYITSKRAKEGDEKAIKLLLDLHKKVKSDTKIASQVFFETDNDIDDDDGLVLD